MSSALFCQINLPIGHSEAGEAERNLRGRFRFSLYSLCSLLTSNPCSWHFPTTTTTLPSGARIKKGKT